MMKKKDPVNDNKRPNSGTGDPLASEIRQPVAIYDRAFGEAPQGLKTPSLFAKDYLPRTPLGARLLEIRHDIETSGTPLLSLAEIEHELTTHRDAHLHGGE